MSTTTNGPAHGANTGTAPVIQVKDLYKIYHLEGEDVRALDGVSLTIQRNEFVAIMGPSGSGKSTLMNVIGCLDVPTSGSYVLNGAEVHKMEDDELAHIRNKEIGFVFQTFNLLPRADALHNVELPMIYAGCSPQERRRRAQGALNLVGMGDRMRHRPSQLSGGQRQRVAIARALVNNPSIILADEPTGNLDSKSGEDVMQALRDIHSQGNTVILVTHEPEIAANALRIIRVRDGKIESDERVGGASHA